MLTVRALRAQDRADLLELDATASDRSIYRRFLSLDRHQADAYVSHQLALDPASHRSLVATRGARIVGIASYERLDEASAEIAMLVGEHDQHSGVGHALLTQLIVDARADGFQTLHAEILAENRPMLQLVRDTHLELTTSYEGPIVHVQLDLTRAWSSTGTTPETASPRQRQ